jgi:hypothetical protein
MAGKSCLVQSVVHASEILRAFQSRGEALRLRDPSAIYYGANNYQAGREDTWTP